MKVLNQFNNEEFRLLFLLFLCSILVFLSTNMEYLESLSTIKQALWGIPLSFGLFISCYIVTRSEK